MAAANAIPLWLSLVVLLCLFNDARAGGNPCVGMLHSDHLLDDQSGLVWLGEALDAVNYDRNSALIPALL